jgi:hypothetical protein
MGCGVEHDSQADALGRRLTVFRFTIRELVLVTAIVALAFGWGIDHWAAKSRGIALAKHSQRLHDQLGRAKGEVDQMSEFFFQNFQGSMTVMLPADWRILDEPIPQH